MRKIPTIFERETAKRGHPLTPVINETCQWVMNGEGIETVKLDGVNVRVQQGVLFLRRKPTRGEYTDASYVLAERGNPAHAVLFLAFDDAASQPQGVGDGIYEVIGPRINGNPHREVVHEMVRIVPPDPGLLIHSTHRLERSFLGIQDFFERFPRIEGIVFHHADGRMGKIKRADFGLRWPVK